MDFENKNLKDKDQKVLRTYTSDMAEAIRDNEVSVIKIALAEKEKREQYDIYKRASGTNLSKILLVIGGVILITAGAVGSYFLFQKKEEAPQARVDDFKTFINYDSYINIDVTNIFDATALLNKINENTNTGAGLIKALFLTKKINDTSEILTTNNFLSLIKSSAPGTLTRSLSDKYLLGKYEKPNKDPIMFLIFETTNYSQTYASMLDWEKTMLRDIYTVFNLRNIPIESPAFERSWKDIIINNQDARVLYGENGEGLLYYVFINKNNFVITSDKDVLKELISRLISSNIKP